jgi:hypothetical protein
MIKSFLVNGVDKYLIDYRRQSNGTFKIYATERPADPHGLGVKINHVYSDGEICVAPGHEPRMIERAIAITHMWMHGYSAYIRDPNGAFPNKACRVEV